MSTDLIRYDLLVQEALKSVVKRVLTDTVRDGLPGEHHFYVSFRTDHAGVRLSPRLRERYPQDMTIVLQHQYENLQVNDTAFEVGLSFSGIPERLRVPFDAVTGFFDPSVQFGLKFEVSEAEEEDEETPETTPSAEIVPAARTSVPTLAARRGEAAADRKGEAQAERKPAAKAGAAPKAAAEAEGADAAGSGEVVSLDSFRKKS